MSRTIITRNIKAPIELVFKTVANISEFSKAIPHIVKVEYLSDIKSGVGARFRETRLMKGKETPTELEVTEYVKNDRVRLVADSHGTVWDTVFTVKREGDHTTLTMTMDARSTRLITRVVVFMISGMVKKAIGRDMDSVKAHCERQ